MFRIPRMKTLGVFAGVVFFAGAASAQVTPEQEIADYDQPEQSRCFFMCDRTVPGAGRVLGGGLTAEEEIALYDGPWASASLFARDGLARSDPDVTGSIVARRDRALRAEETRTLYED